MFSKKFHRSIFVLTVCFLAPSVFGIGLELQEKVTKPLPLLQYMRMGLTLPLIKVTIGSCIMVTEEIGIEQKLEKGQCTGAEKHIDGCKYRWENH